MANVILGHPYSGALFGYFSDQISGDWSHTVAAANHPYYRTLYGRNYKKYVELALTFLLLYDQVWVTPADNPLPTSRTNPEAREFIEELGLHADFEDFRSVVPYGQDNHLGRYLEDKQLQGTFKKFGIPQKRWQMILESACYEAGLSVRNRIPLLCSPGRRALIDRVVEIDRPAMHPILPSLREVQFIESYRALTGMALSPKNLDDLMDAKPDKAVRTYGARFLTIALEEGTTPGAATEARVAALIREAMDTQRLSSLFAGALRWAATSFRLIGAHGLAAASGLSAEGATYFGNREGWYEFSGSIDKAISRAELIRRIDERTESN